MTLSEFKVNYKYKTLRYFFSYKKYKISLVNNDLCKLSINTSYSIWKLIKKTSVLKLYIQDFMCSQICKKNLNAVGYGDTCNNNINIFYTCIRIAKKRNRYRVVIKDIHLIFWNTVSNLWDFLSI